MMCKRCILVPEIHGDVTLDADGVCNYCTAYELIREELNDRPAMEARLRERLEQAKRKRVENEAEYDCIVPVSGGKDSSYLILKLSRAFDVKLLAVSGFTEYTNPQARENVERVCRHFGVDCRFVRGWEAGELKFARQLFLDIGTVCPACLGVFARIVMVGQELRVPAVIMGDSRDQMFDGNPTLTALGIRKGHRDNTLEYGEREHWWANTYSKIFAALTRLAGQTLSGDRQACDAVTAPYRQVAAGSIPDFIPFYFFMGHNEIQMVRELEEVGWKNLDRGLLGHPDCRFQLFSRDPVGQSRSLGVYIREGVLSRQQAVKELIRDLDANVARDEEKLLEDAAKVVGLQRADLTGCAWLEVKKPQMKELARRFLAMLRAMPEAQ
ncbi:MAG: hypothetical protein AB1726_11205 [Planctomycetota bacterium]